MKVKIMERVVYHRCAEIEIDIPNDVKTHDVGDYIRANEELWVDKLNDANDKSLILHGFGMDSDEGWVNVTEPYEVRFDVVGENYGGHL